jgi:hypothetical protein
VLLVRRQGRLQHVRPAEPLKLRRDLTEIQVGVVAAAGADELKHAGVAAFHPAIGDTDRAAAHEGRPAMPELAGQGERQEDLSTGTQPRITLMTRAARCRVSARDRSQPGTGHDLRDRRAAHLITASHLAPRQTGEVTAVAGVWSSGVRYHAILSGIAPRMSSRAGYCVTADVKRLGAYAGE